MSIALLKKYPPQGGTVRNYFEKTYIIKEQCFGKTGLFCCQPVRLTRCLPGYPFGGRLFCHMAAGQGDSLGYMVVIKAVIYIFPLTAVFDQSAAAQGIKLMRYGGNTHIKQGA